MFIDAMTRCPGLALNNRRGGGGGGEPLAVEVRREVRCHCRCLRFAIVTRLRLLEEEGGGRTRAEKFL